MAKYRTCKVCNTKLVSLNNQTLFCIKCNKNICSKITYNKKCIICGSDFISFSSLINVCSKNCFLKKYKLNLEKNKETDEHKRRVKIFQSYNNCCQLCNKKMTSTRKLHLHHIIPKNYDGSDDDNNLIPLCLACHARVHRFGKIKEYAEYLTKFIKYPKSIISTTEEYTQKNSQFKYINLPKLSEFLKSNHLNKNDYVPV